MNILFLGPPGVGKGTQAALFQPKDNIYHFPSGEVIRRTLEQHPEKYNVLRDFVSQGKNASPEHTDEVLLDALKAIPHSTHILMDGHPRTFDAIENAFMLLEKSGRQSHFDLVFVFEGLSQEKLAERMRRRTRCAQCGFISSRDKHLVCPNKNCQEINMTIRLDDQEEKIVLNRLTQYEQEKEKMLDYFRKQINETKVVVLNIEQYATADALHAFIVQQMKMAQYKMYHKLLIQSGEGQVSENLFVDRPGVLCLATSNQPNQSPENIHVTFLLAGISVECSLELLAHHEASVARLTTSCTKAMHEPLYTLQTDSIIPIEKQKEFIRQMIELRKKQFKETELSDEWTQSFQPGLKATSLCYTMNLLDYHKLLIGRLSPKGNEKSIQSICQRMHEYLFHHFPEFIQPLEVYQSGLNAKKYQLVQTQIKKTLDESKEKNETRVTVRAKELFGQLNSFIASKSVDWPIKSEWYTIAEFQARITYLSFPMASQEEKSYSFVNLVAQEHKSILAAVWSESQCWKHFF